MQSGEGWEWRKYGQKNLKDPDKYRLVSFSLQFLKTLVLKINCLPIPKIFFRSYFRCAERICQAKKILDIHTKTGESICEEIIGQYNHPQPFRATRVHLVYNKERQQFENLDPNPPLQ